MSGPRLHVAGERITQVIACYGGVEYRLKFIDAGVGEQFRAFADEMLVRFDRAMNPKDAIRKLSRAEGTVATEEHAREAARLFWEQLV